MEILLKFVTVLGLGIIGLWVAILAGIALKLHPLLNGIASATGSIIGATVVVFCGERDSSWLLKKRSWKKAKDGFIEYGINTE